MTALVTHTLELKAARLVRKMDNTFLTNVWKSIHGGHLDTDMVNGVRVDEWIELVHLEMRNRGLKSPGEKT